MRLPIQIQDDFSGASLATLSESGLKVYDLIPDYRDRCPLCDGEKCAVRHGLYRRRVTDREGALYESFPIPRFRCRRRGPRPPEAATFSVLPVQLIPRRRSSLPLMIWTLELLLLARQSIDAVLDALAEAFEHHPNPWFPDPPAVYQVLHLFSDAYSRLRLSPLAGVELRPASADARGRAEEMLRLLSDPIRGKPVALEFHQRYFPKLLF